jgi:hypothetical protein
VGTELVTSLAMDHVGFLGMPQRRLQLDRLLGVSLVATGCALSVLGSMDSAPPEPELSGDQQQPPPPVRGLLVLLSSVQACVNRRVSSRLPIKGECSCL